MVINGHFGDGDDVMHSSIMVMMRKGGTGTGDWPSF
jgi:hypothetical protein